MSDASLSLEQARPLTLQQRLGALDAPHFSAIVDGAEADAWPAAVATLFRASVGALSMADINLSNNLVQIARESAPKPPAPGELCALLGKAVEQHIEPNQLAPKAGIACLADVLPASYYGATLTPVYARLAIVCCGVKFDTLHEVLGQSPYAYGPASSRISSLLVVDQNRLDRVLSKLNKALRPPELPPVLPGGPHQAQHLRWAAEALLDLTPTLTEAVAVASADKQTEVLRVLSRRFLTLPQNPKHDIGDKIRRFLHFCSGYSVQEVSQREAHDVKATGISIRRAALLLCNSLTSADQASILNFLTSNDPSAELVLGAPERVIKRKALLDIPALPDGESQEPQPYEPSKPQVKAAPARQPVPRRSAAKAETIDPALQAKQRLQDLLVQLARFSHLNRLDRAALVNQILAQRDARAPSGTIPTGLKATVRDFIAAEGRELKPAHLMVARRFFGLGTDVAGPMHLHQIVQELLPNLQKGDPEQRIVAYLSEFCEALVTRLEKEGSS